MTAAPKDLIAYFSMEIALASEIPTYSGGLGVLAGDTLRSAADMGLPMVGVTLLYRKGYFRQVLDSHGRQTEKDVVWAPELHLERLHNEVMIHIQGRDLRIGVWRYRVVGVDGHHIPVYLLDTDLQGNSADDRRIPITSTASRSATGSRRRRCSASAGARCSSRSGSSRPATT